MSGYTSRTPIRSCEHKGVANCPGGHYALGARMLQDWSSSSWSSAGDSSKESVSESLFFAGFGDATALQSFLTACALHTYGFSWADADKALLLQHMRTMFRSPCAVAYGSPSHARYDIYSLPDVMKKLYVTRSQGRVRTTRVCHDSEYSMSIAGQRRRGNMSPPSVWALLAADVLCCARIPSHFFTAASLEPGPMVCPPGRKWFAGLAGQVIAALAGRARRRESSSSSAESCSNVGAQLNRRWVISCWKPSRNRARLPGYSRQLA